MGAERLDAGLRQAFSSPDSILNLVCLPPSACPWSSFWMGDDALVGSGGGGDATAGPVNECGLLRECC